MQTLDEAQIRNLGKLQRNQQADMYANSEFGTRNMFQNGEYSAYVENYKPSRSSYQI